MKPPESRPHRVLLVETNDDGTAGGSYQCLFDLACNLDRRRFEPVAVFYNQNEFARRLRDAGVEVHIWKRQRRQENSPDTGLLPFISRIGRRVQAILHRARFIRRARIDLIHLNNSPAAGCEDWLPASRLSRVPCITHARGEVSESGGWFRDFWRVRFDRVIAISRHIEAAMQRLGIPSERILQIYDGIDIDRFRSGIVQPRAEARRSLGVPEDGILFAMVGHIRRWKGQDVVLESLARLDEATRLRVHVLFVGPIPSSAIQYHERLLERVREAGLSDQVSFLGQRSDVAEIMNAADVVLHASTDPEPFGLVVVEGLALGKPVVASGLGGPAEIITSASGITFDPHDPEALPKVMTRLVWEPELRRSLSEPAMSRAAEFPIARTVEAIERVYADLLPHQRRARAPQVSRPGLRIALLIDLAPRKRGSLEDWVIAMVRDAGQRGHKVDVFGMEPIQPAIQLELEGLGAGWAPVKALRADWLRGIRTLRRYDVILINLFASRHPISLMAYAAWPAAVVLVDNSSGGLPELGGLKRLRHRLLNLLTRPRVSRVVGVSDFVRDRAKAEMQLPDEKAVTIYNGVDLQRFAPAPGSRPSDGFHIVCVANLIPEKGVDIALRAQALLQLPDSRLAIVGDGPDRAELDRLAEELGTRSQVTFMGLRDDVQLLLQESHVFVHPATWPEAFGLAITEAMGVGCPVVASRVGAIPELVDHGKDGFLFTAGDSAELARALRLLHDDPGLARRLARNARQRAEARFSLVRCVREHIDLLERVAAEGRVRRADPVRPLASGG